jgi:hypothetical protein
MNFTLPIKWASITAALSFIALLTGALAGLPILEPYAPATRSYARSLVEMAQAADTAQTAQITTGLLDLKATALAGQLEALKNQDDMLKARLATAGADDIPFLRGLEATLARQVRDKTDELAATCDQLHASGSRAPCGL